jgi:ribonuclease D
VARRQNRPLFKVMGDKTLIAIAASLPESREQLREIPGMNQRQIEKHGEGVLEAVRQGLQDKPINPPHNPRPADDYLERLDQLKDWRKRTARKLGVESDVVLPRDLLLAIAERNPGCRSDLAEVLEGAPWRLAHYGDQILKMLGSV